MSSKAVQDAQKGANESMADKVYISQIKTPNGSVYDIKDAEARELIAALGNPLKYRGKTTTALEDGSTTNPITINGESYTAIAGDVVTYTPAGGRELEFVFDGTYWQEFGSTGSLKALAFKDSASGDYQPEGSVSVTTATTENKTATVSAAASGEATYTPAGSVSLSNENVTAAVGTEAIDASHAKTYTPAGSVSLTNSDVSTTVAPAASGDPTYTPAGSVSLSNENVTAAVGTEQIDQDHAATYTPAGSVAAPSISVATAGSTATVNNPTSQTVAKTVVAAAPEQTAPDNAITYYSVANEVLTLFQLGYTTGDSISTSEVTVKTGDAAYEASAPAFSGTAARLVTDNISVPSSASFSGTGTRLETGNISVPSSATFAGTDARLVTENISVPSSATFSGEGARLETGNIAVPSTFAATFSGTPATVTVS